MLLFIFLLSLFSGAAFPAAARSAGASTAAPWNLGIGANASAAV